MKYILILILAGFGFANAQNYQTKQPVYLGISSGVFCGIYNKSSSSFGKITVTPSLFLPFSVSLEKYLNERHSIDFTAMGNILQHSLKVKYPAGNFTYVNKVAVLYKHGAFFTFGITFYYRPFSGKLNKFEVGAGPVLYYQQGKGLLTSETSTVSFKDSSMSLNLLYITDSQVSSVNNFTWGFWFNLRYTLKNSNKANAQICLTYGDSFLPLRRTVITSTLNGAFYDHVSAVYTGKMFVFSLIYKFKV